MSYAGYSLQGRYDLTAEMQSVYSTTPFDWARKQMIILKWKSAF